MTYILLFILVVAVIGIITHKLNAKTPCDHNWEDQGKTVSCCKCGKKIPNYVHSYSESLSEAA